MAADDEPTDKRQYQRYPIFFPVTVHIGDEDVMGVCRDASAGGALVASASPMQIDAVVTARFRASTELRDEHTVKARVVRVGLSTDEMQLAFPYLVALDFDEPLPDLLADLEVHSTKKP